ncbi:MAG: hypothetical protein ACYC6A_05260 [Armatimonadota bacterium]
MKARFTLLMLLIAVAVALAAAGWHWSENRRVDGLSGREWLAKTEHAAQTVPYHAEGRTTVEGKQAKFTVDQDTGGRYCMRIVNADGRSCSMGYDGKRAWYSAKDKQESAVPSAKGPTAALHGRVTGISTVAGRPAVLLSVHSRSVKKLLAVDRETGVVLSMRTMFGDKRVSEMVLEKIEYRAVEPTKQAPDAEPVLTAATLQQLSKLLGQPVLQPGSVPRGMTLEGTYRDLCPCCNTDMAVLRYTDGLATLTLFEMRGMICAMEGGCHMAPGANALVESRTIGDITVAAVGTVSAKELDRVLDSLK